MEYTLENIKMSTNQVKGTINLSQDRILVLSIPYSRGWRGYINGEPTEVMRANTMFMAMEVPEGEHEITLIYWTPMLTEGLIATCLGFGTLGGIVIYFERKYKKNQQD